ncbi:MAG: biotin transporter BioY [bacterium]|nr:biotin transporter BioY [bacterium]
MNDDSNISTSFIKVYKYVPQIPVVFFIIALLGRKFGIITILGYILLGMFFPIFALGGGISYLFEFGFGYILAFIPSVFLTGTLLKIKTDFLRIVLMGVLGVLSIHILGTLYMLFITTLRHTPSEIILGWISAQSGAKIFYDMIFSIMALYIGRWSKRLLWLALC